MPAERALRGGAGSAKGDGALELREYLEILKRHKWFIIEAVLVVGLAAGILSNLRTPVYQATARVLLHPNDPAEQLDPNNTPRPNSNDPDRYVKGQEDIVASEPVAAEAAKLLPGETVNAIEAKASVAQGGQSDILKISAKDVDPERARDISNAVAKGYIENRRQAAVANLQQAADDIGQQLPPLLSRIADLDTQIGGTPPHPAKPATTSVQGPTQPTVSAPTPATAQLDPSLGDLGGGPSSQEALKAARYSAALQYETQYARQQELLVDISLKRGEAELVAEAKTPTSPISPRPKRDAALGVFVGLLLGFGVSFLREQLNDKVRSADEVERITELPLLAQLPYDAQAAKEGGITVSTRPSSALSEAMRSLRTSVQYLSVDHPVETIVVTSAVPGEGKSLVSANLAAAFAQAGYRTVLISADLRRTSIETLFEDLDESPGLTGLVGRAGAIPAHVRSNGNGHGVPGTAVATKTAPFGVVSTGIPNLVLLPAGDTPPNPAELLGSRRMSEVLAELKLSADVIIIDTPPLLPVTDAAVLAAKSDGVVLVSALNETRRQAVVRAKGVVVGTGARLLGVVVNKSPRSSHDRHYYRGYYGEHSRRGRQGLSDPASLPIDTGDDAVAASL